MLAIAVTLCLLGLECLVVKRATLSLQSAPNDTPALNYDLLDPAADPLLGAVGTKRVIEPPEWAPFGLLSAGIVLLLYSKTMPAGG
jgi:hypothetical protein